MSQTTRYSIVIPFRPHKWQKRIYEALQRFSVLVCHRRFGKTVLTVNVLIREALKTKRNDWRGAYLAPLYRQAKAAAWDYLRRYSAVVPGVKVFTQDLRVEFPNGSRIMLLGADNPESLRGMYLDYAVLDEYQDMRQEVWGEILRPALADRRGKAVFIGTPRGHTQLYEMWQMAEKTRNWMRMMFKASETEVLNSEELLQIRDEITSEEYAQEFECSFEAAIRGTYYGKLLETAEAEGRVCNVPYDPAMPVHTAWDLGMADATAIWFVQSSPAGEVRVIDYYEDSGEGMPFYARKLDELRYKYGKHLAPHDIKVRELGTGKSRMETAESLGLVFEVGEQLPVMDGIDAVRSVLPRCYFDKKKCAQGLEALKQYRKQYSDRLSTYQRAPLHDWASHGADAFRILAVGFDSLRPGPQLKPLRVPRYADQSVGWMA